MLFRSGIKKETASKEASRHFAEFGLSGYEKAWPHQLSGGMRKRAAFLRTTLTGASIMLLDEPFAALDALTRIQMQNWLLERLRCLGSSIVLVTHDVEEALYVCDRVIVLSINPAKIVGEVLCDSEKSPEFRYSDRMTHLKQEVSALL